MLTPEARIPGILAVVVLALVLHKRTFLNKEPDEHNCFREYHYHLGQLELQRIAAICHAGPVDHAGVVLLLPTPYKNRVQNLSTSAALWKVAGPDYFARPLWPLNTINSILAYSSKLPNIQRNPKLMYFLDEIHMGFGTTHGTGTTFGEHVSFCHDYAALHFKQHSPNVLLLHSAFGTAQNTFPLSASQVPVLRKLVTDFELRHIEAFPSVLRIKLSLITQLENTTVNQLKAIRFHRVWDNKVLLLTSDDLWIALNYQLIHAIDFFYARCWSAPGSVENLDRWHKQFKLLYDFLKRNEKLEADVRYDDVRFNSRSKRFCTAASSDMIEAQLAEAHQYSPETRSSQIGHNMSFSMIF